MWKVRMLQKNVGSSEQTEEERMPKPDKSTNLYACKTLQALK